MAVEKKTFIPSRPSNLRMSSPRSPASQQSPPHSIVVVPHTPLQISVPAKLGQLPLIPPLWTWNCHLCHSSYPLGVTRRCLHDGHFFCAGMTVDKATGAKKKHNACGSVFDYAGWKAWGEWRRIQRQDVDDLNQEGSKDCINRCDYPSQCRWIIKQTPKQARFYSDSLRSNESIPEKDSVNHLQKLTDSTGKRTNQLSSLLSPVHEYEEGLGSENPELGFPVLDFAAFKASLRHPQGHPGNNDKMSAPIMIVPEVDENFEEERTSLDNIELPLRKASGTNPASAGEPSSTRTQFLHRPENITNDEASPTSPRRNAWDWTYKGSDVALSIPGEWKFDTEVEVGEIQSEK